MSPLGRFRWFHFVGIGGIGMSALAEILLRRGYIVSGSDRQLGSVTGRLEQLGAAVFEGHSARNIQNAEVIVYSSAISEDNPELSEGRKQGLKLWHRADLLAALMQNQHVITVTGTHGKTTTVAMLGLILTEAERDPTVVVGARVTALGGNARVGNSGLMVAEADESDRSFLKYSPDCAVITNIDLDHLDEYKDLDDLVGAFRDHLQKVPSSGQIVACAEDPNLLKILKNIHTPVLTYGLESGADLCASGVRLLPFGSRFDCLYKGEFLGVIELSVPGYHNVLNALGAVGVSLMEGISFGSLQSSLIRFAGAERRLQRKGQSNDVWVLDDYGHHPAEIQATLSACQQLRRRILLVFQPHRYSRTLHLMDELADSFSGADRLYLMDVYSAGEAIIEGADSQALADKIARKRQVLYVPSRQAAVNRLRRDSRPGDLIVTMGAGDVWQVGEQFLEEEEKDKT